MLDYSKFDKLGKELDEEEEKEKEDNRRESRERYEKNQLERQKKWEDEQRLKGKSAKEIEEMKKAMMSGGCGHNHMNALNNQKPHNHNHSHDHDHDHDHSKCNHDHNHQVHESEHEKKKVPFNKPSCGFMPIEEIQRLEQEKKNTPQLSNEEKNVKKMQAVKATREDGNNYYKKGDYKTAFKIYERGVLIINGMYGLNDKDYEEMEHYEYLLDLNMAACKLQMQEWTDAIDNAKMALQLNDQSAKAYYRWSHALIGMSEYEEAKIKCLKAIELCNNNVEEKKSCDILLQNIEKLNVEQINKAKENEKIMAKRISQTLNK